MFIFLFPPPILIEDGTLFPESGLKSPIPFESFVGNSQFEVRELFLINSEI
jgi:hypothetical protein